MVVCCITCACTYARFHVFESVFHKSTVSCDFFLICPCEVVYNARILKVLSLMTRVATPDCGLLSGLAHSQNLSSYGLNLVCCSVVHSYLSCRRPSPGGVAFHALCTCFSLERFLCTVTFRPERMHPTRKGGCLVPVRAQALLRYCHE